MPTSTKPSPLSWSEIPDLEKPNQQTPPIETTGSQEETVTIIDPRHPLYGLTFPLIDIINKPRLGRCCVISIKRQIERSVPLAATNRAVEPISIPSLPLNLSTVRQLLATYEKIHKQLEGSTADETENQVTNCRSTLCNQRQQTSNQTQASVGATDSDSTTDRVSDSGFDLSRSAPASQPNHSAGGAK